MTIRRYRPTDFEPTVRLVQKVFLRSIMPDATPEGAEWWSGFLTLEGDNGERLRQLYAGETIGFVAVEADRIVGVAMGTTRELKRLFVEASSQRQGLGRSLLARFEQECLRQGGTQYRIVAALHAVPFYQRMGCRKTTGVRNIHGLPIQPMRKVLTIAP